MSKNHPLYGTYNAAKTRCNNKNFAQYKDYGGRGIKFLFESFEQFLKELGEKPSKEYTLDRIDNDGNYEPGNVRWATRKEQNNKQRLRKDSACGFPGISYHTGINKWVSRTYINKKRVHLYAGDSFGDALAYLILAKEYQETLQDNGDGTFSVKE